MLGPIRVIRAYRQRGDDCIRALKLEADRDPDGFAKYMLSLAFWEQDDLVEAHRLALPILEDSPEDFHLLAICAAYHLRQGDQQQIDHFARRLAMARNPAPADRRAHAVIKLLLAPLRLFGFRGNSGKYQDSLDAWAAWAREYVEANPSPDPRPWTREES